MTFIKTISKIFLSLIAVGTLAACSSTPRNLTGVEVQKRNIVEHVRLTQTVSFRGEEGRYLSEADEKEITHFLKRTLINYSDLVSLDIAPSPHSEDKRAALKEFLKYRGITLADGNPISGPLPNKTQGVLVVDRYISNAPRCDFQSLNNNLQTPNHGCSSQTILGQMVANPRDMIDGQSFRNASTQNQIKSLNGFKSGQASNAPLPSPVTGSQSSTNQPQS